MADPFDPDAFMAQRKQAQPAGFDPDAFMAQRGTGEPSVPGTPQPPKVLSNTTTYTHPPGRGASLGISPKEPLREPTWMEKAAPSAAFAPLQFGNAVSHPLDTAMGVLNGLRHPFTSAWPLAHGDPEAVGSFVGGLPITVAIGEGMPDLRNIPSLARELNPMKVDPRIAINRSLRPVPSNPDFPENIPQTLSSIKALNPGFKPGIENGQLNLIPAADKAIAAHKEALAPWLQRAEGQRISGAPIVQATREATGRMLPSEAEAGRGLVSRAQADYGDFAPQELRDRLALLNQRLSPFYNGSPMAQSHALADIPEAVLKAQRDATADTLYRGLDPENQGAGPREIQARTGNLIDLRDAAMRRNNAIVAEQPLTPLGRIVDPIKGAIRQLIPWKGSGAGLSFAEGSEGRSLPLLRRAFNAVSETEGANAFRELPRPGPRTLAAPADTSGPLPAGVADFRSAGQAPRGPLLLPPASSGIGVSGTIVPDILGKVPLRGAGAQALLPAPEPGESPMNVLPTGPLNTEAVTRTRYIPSKGVIDVKGKPVEVGPGLHETLGPAAPPVPPVTPLPREGTRGGRLLDILKDYKPREDWKPRK
jgi:hypothetical protein